MDFEIEKSKQFEAKKITLFVVCLVVFALSLYFSTYILVWAEEEAPPPPAPSEPVAEAPAPEPVSEPAPIVETSESSSAPEDTSSEPSSSPENSSVETGSSEASESEPAPQDAEDSTAEPVVSESENTQSPEEEEAIQEENLGQEIVSDVGLETEPDIENATDDNEIVAPEEEVLVEDSDNTEEGQGAGEEDSDNNEETSEAPSPTIFILGSGDVTQEEIEEILASSTPSDVVATSTESMNLDSDSMGTTTQQVSENIEEVGSSTLATTQNSEWNLSAIEPIELPPVLAIWAMNTETDLEEKYLGTDDSIELGSQFVPSGEFQVGKDIAVCAIVTNDIDPESNDQVYADIVYPKGISINKSCEETKKQVIMNSLGTEENLDLFCDKIRNSNNNLPGFASSSDQLYNNLSDLASSSDQLYSFDDICTSSGELSKENFNIYCGEVGLAYSDPAGEYQMLFSQVINNATSTIATSSFDYLELTAFEADFSNVDYGAAKLNIPQMIEGDINFLLDDKKPTIRNVGNTRMSIIVEQSDLGTGKSYGTWNIKYQARVGTSSVFSKYPPEEKTKLKRPFDLGDIANADFSAKVLQFADTDASIDYLGNLRLSAIRENYYQCEKIVNLENKLDKQNDIL